MDPMLIAWSLYPNLYYPLNINIKLELCKKNVMIKYGHITHPLKN